jgi:tetratricopeptide (TPR) repeat protein
VGLGGLLAKEKRYAEACEHFEHALEIAPNAPSANANYAGLLIEMKNYELAGQHLERAFQNNPNDLDAIVNMAHLQTRLENFAEAVKYYQAAVLGIPNDEELQSSLIASLIRSGSLSHAVTSSHDHLDRRPNSAKANVDYASALIASGRNAEAVAFCERAIALDDQLSTAHATLATLETVPDKAIERMKRAVSLEPMSFDYNRALGDMLMGTRPLDAVGHFEIALQTEPDCVEVLLRIGGAWDACGYPEKGIPYLERVTQLLPDWVEARQSLEALRKRFERP